MCCKCRSLLPAEAAYCTKCRLPLGVSRCPEGHANPLRTRGTTCQTCNKGPLTAGVAVLPLSGLASICAVLVLFAVLRWAWHHPYTVAVTAWNWGGSAMGVLFDVPSGRVQSTVMQILAWYVLLWAISFILPSGLGRPARQSLRTLPLILWKGLRSVLKTLRSLVVLPARPQRGKANVAAKPQDKDKD